LAAPRHSVTTMSINIAQLFVKNDSQISN
jgi:hypothetical protein